MLDKLLIELGKVRWWLVIPLGVIGGIVFWSVVCLILI